MSDQSFPEKLAMRFAVCVWLHRDASPSDEVRFQRSTEDWLSRHELQAEGSQTSFVVVADRELTAVDQANALLAMLSSRSVRHVRIGPVEREGEEAATKLAAGHWVEADRDDLKVLAARVLYEAGRLDGEAFLDALGGYVCRASMPVVEPAEELP